MRRAISTLGVAAFLFACGPAPRAAAPNSDEAPATPRSFVPPDKSFRITFPTAWLEPVSKDPGTSSAETGARAHVTRGAVKDVYEATYTDVADLDLVPSVDLVVDGLAKQGSIRFDARRPARIGALVGSEIDLRASDHVERWRYFRVGNRWFAFGVSTTDRELPKATTAFLESFAVTGTAPQRVRRLPADMDVQLPSDDWQLGANATDDAGADCTVFARRESGKPPSEDPAPLLRVCSRPLPTHATLAGFEASQSERDHYSRDAALAPGTDWPIGLSDAIGFRAHVDAPRRVRALVFYTVQRHSGVTLAVEASDSEFQRLEPELRGLLGSVRAAPRR